MPGLWPTRLDGQHISCRSSAGRCLIIHHKARASRPMISIFPYISRNFGQRQRFHNDTEAVMSVTVVPIPGGRLLRHRIQKSVPRCDKCLNSEGEYVENSWTLAVSVPINLSIKLSFVSINGPMKTYYVDMLHIYVNY